MTFASRRRQNSWDKLLGHPHIGQTGQFFFCRNMISIVHLLPLLAIREAGMRKARIPNEAMETVDRWRASLARTFSFYGAVASSRLLSSTPSFRLKELSPLAKTSYDVPRPLPNANALPIARLLASPQHIGRDLHVGVEIRQPHWMSARSDSSTRVD